MNTNLSLFSFDVRSYSGRVQHYKVVNRVLSDDICHMGCRLLTTLAVVLAATAYTSLLAGVFAVAFLGGGRLLLLLSILLLFSACLLRLQIRVHVLYGDPLHAQDHVVLHQVMVVHSLLGEVGGDEVQVGHHSELFIVA